MAGSREQIDKSTISDSELHDNKIQLITDLAKRSRGGDISPEVLSILRSLAAGVLSLTSIRASLSESIENLMKTIAPNLNEILTSVIAARLMARAGSLRRLALLPASTIQILGAEKALFRALKTGARPPKHGVLFQHPAVHSASKWQRGKIARTLASKIAIAARVDFYRHSLLEEDFFANLKKRIEEIQKSNPKRVSRGEMLDLPSDTHKKEFNHRKGNRRMKWSKGKGRHEKRSIRFGRKR
jgi:nucleolar protein 56